MVIDSGSSALRSPLQDIVSATEDRERESVCVSVFNAGEPSEIPSQ